MTAQTNINCNIEEHMSVFKTNTYVHSKNALRVIIVLRIELRVRADHLVSVEAGRGIVLEFSLFCRISSYFFMSPIMCSLTDRLREGRW